jgi:hypothetical protein
MFCEVILATIRVSRLQQVDVDKCFQGQAIFLGTSKATTKTSRCTAELIVRSVLSITVKNWPKLSRNYYKQVQSSGE